jgi:hypothetical protein
MPPISGHISVACETEVFDSELKGLAMGPGAQLNVRGTIKITELDIEMESGRDITPRPYIKFLTDAGKVQVSENAVIHVKLQGALPRLPTTEWDGIYDTTLIIAPQAGFSVQDCNRLAQKVNIVPQNYGVTFAAKCDVVTVGKLLASQTRLYIEGVGPTDPPGGAGDDGAGSEGDDNGLGGGAVAGIVIAVAVVVAIIAAIVTYTVVKRKNRVNQDVEASA